MANGRASFEEKTEEDKPLTKSLQYFCKGRGCRHKGEPELRPTAICFYIAGFTFSHVEVYDRVKDLLVQYPMIKILDIQYVPLAVHLDTPGTENRWIITLNTVAARNQIAGTTLHIRGRKVTLRRYDDIIMLEYRKCSRTKDVQDMVDKINNFTRK
ncbi:hypothetical protein ACF0H5_008456 [Mactra antiquata]